MTASFCILLTGCGRIQAPVVPPLGGLYTRVEAPLDLNSQGGKGVGPRYGEASVHAVMGLWSTGDASVEAAARNGGISRINHVDYRYRSLLWGLVTEFTTVVRGE